MTDNISGLDALHITEDYLSAYDTLCHAHDLCITAPAAVALIVDALQSGALRSRAKKVEHWRNMGSIEISATKPWGAVPATPTDYGPCRLPKSFWRHSEILEDTKSWNWVKGEFGVTLNRMFGQLIQLALEVTFVSRDVYNLRPPACDATTLIKNSAINRANSPPRKWDWQSAYIHILACTYKTNLSALVGDHDKRGFKAAVGRLFVDFFSDQNGGEYPAGAEIEIHVNRLVAAIRDRLSRFNGTLEPGKSPSV